MTRTNRTFFSRLMAGESGQALPYIAFIGSVSMALGGGLALDVGRAYVIRTDLQNYANAMALAAAGNVYNTSSTNSATTTAGDYSATQGDENYNSGLGTVTPTVTPICANILEPSGTTCTSSSVANAVRVSESTTFNTFFMRLFGITTLTVTADATASMQGAAKPWNVAILLDATQSMTAEDTNCGGLTEFQCAEQGVGTMLGAINPCDPGHSSCTPTNNSQFRVSLFQMPNASYNSSMYSTPCSITWSNVAYTLPTNSPTSSTGYSTITYTSSNGKSSFTGTYQVSPWTSGYYSATSTSTSELNTSDPLIEEIGTTSNKGVFSSGCLPDKGGESSYMAGAIYAATASLEAEQSAVPNSENAIIVLTDAQAQATSADFPAAGDTASINGVAQTALDIVTKLLGTTNLIGGTVGTYPDYNDECQQMIVAAQAAKTAGIRVYSVAYGSEDSGCTSSTGGTDSSLVLTSSQIAALNYNFGAVSNITPCITMENVASSLDYFYSDWDQSGSTGTKCEDASHTVVSLQDIFLSIAGSFTNPRLLPNNTSYVVTGS